MLNKSAEEYKTLTNKFTIETINNGTYHNEHVIRYHDGSLMDCYISADEMHLITCMEGGESWNLIRYCSSKEEAEEVVGRFIAHVMQKAIESDLASWNQNSDEYLKKQSLDNILLDPKGVKVSNLKVLEEA